MGEVRKILGQSAPAAVTEEDLYVCSGATKESVTSSIVVCNRSVSASASFRVSISEDGVATANTDYLYYDVVLLPNDTFVAQLGLTMNNLDTIRVYASTANLTFQVFGVEITP